MSSQRDTCVQKILSKKLSPGEKPSKQDLAIAFSECENKQASLAIKNITVKLASLKIARVLQKNRYLTASLNTEFIPDKIQEAQGEGTYASYFLLQGDTINGREWGVTSESIPANIQTFIGRPLVATSDKFIKDSPYGVQYLHPSITHFMQKSPEFVAGLSPMNMNDILQFQEKFKIGTISDVFFDANKNVWNSVIKLAQGVEASDLPPFCSPALYQLDDTEREGDMTKWTGIHLAALDIKPAYGSIALLNGTCHGTVTGCTSQFAGNKNMLTSDIMKIAAQLSTENRNVHKVTLAKKRKNTGY